MNKWQHGVSFLTVASLLGGYALAQEPWPHDPPHNEPPPFPDWEFNWMDMLNGSSQEDTRAVASSSGIGTAGVVTQVSNTVVGSLLAPPLVPQALTPGERAGLENVAALFRYECREFDGPKLNYDRYGVTLRGSFSLAPDLPVDIDIPIDRYNFDGRRTGLFPNSMSANAYDNTTVGVVVSPRYYLINQAENGIDLAAGLTGFYYRTFMDRNTLDDLDTIGGGPMLSLRKDFEKCSLSGGVMMMRGWNMHGDREVTGHNYVDIYRAAINLGVPLTDSIVVNGILGYNYLDNMPSYLENSYMTGGVGITWVIKNNWAVDLTVSTDLGNSDSNNVLAMIGMLWNY